MNHINRTALAVVVVGSCAGLGIAAVSASSSDNPPKEFSVEIPEEARRNGAAGIPGSRSNVDVARDDDGRVVLAPADERVFATRPDPIQRTIPGYAWPVRFEIDDHGSVCVVVQTGKGIGSACTPWQVFTLAQGAEFFFAPPESGPGLIIRINRHDSEMMRDESGHRVTDELVLTVTESSAPP